MSKKREKTKGKKKKKEKRQRIDDELFEELRIQTEEVTRLREVLRKKKTKDMVSGVEDLLEKEMWAAHLRVNFRLYDYVIGYLKSGALDRLQNVSIKPESRKTGERVEIPIDKSVLLGVRRIIYNNLSEQFRSLSEIEMVFPHKNLQKTISDHREVVLGRFRGLIYQEDPSHYSKVFSSLKIRTPLGITLKDKWPPINLEYGAHCGWLHGTKRPANGEGDPVLEEVKSRLEGMGWEAKEDCVDEACYKHDRCGQISYECDAQLIDDLLACDLGFDLKAQAARIIIIAIFVGIGFIRTASAIGTGVATSISDGSIGRDIAEEFVSVGGAMARGLVSVGGAITGGFGSIFGDPDTLQERINYGPPRTALMLQSYSGKNCQDVLENWWDYAHYNLHLYEIPTYTLWPVHGYGLFGNMSSLKLYDHKDHLPLPEGMYVCLNYDTDGYGPYGMLLVPAGATEICVPDINQSSPNYTVRNNQDGDLAGHVRGLTWGPGPMIMRRVWTKTGDRNNAGTNAQVYISLKGTNGEMYREKKLDNPGNTFERGALESFTFGTRDLGDLAEITMSVRNVPRKGGPGWFLETVRVETVTSNWDVYRSDTFKCDQWLHTADSPNQRTLPKSYGYKNY